MIYFKNVIACDCTIDKDWWMGYGATASNLSITYCVDSDNSINLDYYDVAANYGINNIHYITGLLAFSSLIDDSIEFLGLSSTSPLTNRGTADISIYNTSDIEGNLRPSLIGTVSIGAVEAVESQVLLHYYALKKLFPARRLEGVLDDDLTLEGKYLDRTYYQAIQVKNEFFPDTTGQLIPEWQALLNTTSILSRMYYLAHKQGLLSKAYMTAIALGQGFTTTSIVDNISSAFIVGEASYPGTSELPHALYDISAIYTWELHYNLNEALPTASVDKLKVAIYAVMPSYTFVEFIDDTP